MPSRYGDAKYCQVVGLRAAAGKDDFRRAASQQPGPGPPRALPRRSRLLAMMMDGRRIPEALPEVGLHGLQDCRQHGRGGVIVEVDAAHGWMSFYAFLKTGPVGGARASRARAGLSRLH